MEQLNVGENFDESKKLVYHWHVKWAKACEEHARSAKEIGELKKELYETKIKLDQKEYSLQNTFNAWHRVIAVRDELTALLKECVGALTEGGYNSCRETIALMAEGEGDDAQVYRTMANHALKILDAAIAKIPSHLMDADALLKEFSNNKKE